MSMRPLNCPNCGSPSVKSTGNNEYLCTSCGSKSVLDSKVQILVLSAVASILCPKCRKPNSPSARHCGSCGQTLVFPCPFCKSEHLPGERYCPNCGELMRGIPQTDPHDVIAIIEQNSRNWDGKHPLFPRTPQLAEQVKRDLSVLLKPGEMALWTFIAPRNEQSRRNFYGHLLFVIDDNKFLCDGLFIATSSRFLFYKSGTPDKKGLFKTQPGIPSFHTEFPYSEIIRFRIDLDLPMPNNAYNTIFTEYPRDYHPTLQRAVNTTSNGWEMLLKGNRSLRFQGLPFMAMDMNSLRFWESVFRITLGVERADLDYVPF